MRSTQSHFFEKTDKLEKQISVYYDYNNENQAQLLDYLFEPNLR